MATTTLDLDSSATAGIIRYTIIGIPFSFLERTNRLKTRCSGLRKIPTPMPIKSEFPPVEEADEPFPPRLLSTIWQHFAQNPDKTALVNAKAPTTDAVSYGELYAFSLAIATFLQSRGFGPGDVACLALPNCWEYAAIFLGVGLQGGAISGANPMFTEKEFQRQFADCRCKLLFCCPQNLANVLKAIRDGGNGEGGGVPSVEAIILVDSGHSKGRPLPPNVGEELPFGIVPFGRVLRTEPRRPAAADEAFSRRCRPERDVLLLPYSSGTTGTPKGVMISHRNFGTMQRILREHYLAQVYARMEPPYDDGGGAAETELLLLPFFHCYGFGMLANCLLRGATGVLMARFEPELFCRSVQDFKIRLLKIVPPILVFMAKSPMLEKFHLSHLHGIVTGAAPLGSDVCEELRRRLPNLQFILQGFGMTELTVASHLPVFDGKLRYDASGKLASNLEMKIVDMDTGQEVEPGMPGEMHIRGPNVMLGYLRRPRETAEMIDPEGWLRTGDVVYLDNDGFIHVVDRQKELIKVNGLQVSPAEMEDLLLSHPSVQDCAVVGVPDQRAGELPKAFVVPKAGSNLSEEEVREYVKAKAVYYKQLKGGVQFVDSIPKSPSGKILRRLLRERRSKMSAENEQKEAKKELNNGQLSKL